MKSHRFKLDGPSYFYVAPRTSAVALLPISSMIRLQDASGAMSGLDGVNPNAQEQTGVVETIHRPPRYRPTRKREEWYRRLSAIEPGLSISELADRLDSNYLTVQRWAGFFSYAIKDGRFGSNVDWKTLDWTLRDADLARRLDLSRERVRQMRNALSAGLPAPRALIGRFEEFVSGCSAELHGLTLETAIEKFGETIGLHVARRVLRKCGVRLERAKRPTAEIRKIDWRLPNRELAAIWRINPMQVAAARHRYGVGSALWDCRGTDKINDSQFLQLRAAEKARARKSVAVRQKTRATSHS